MAEEKSDWEKKLEPRKANIGFLSKTDAFAEPSEAQKAAALTHEIDSWQETRGKIAGWKVSSPYKIAKGKGTNLKADREAFEPIVDARRDRAIDAYVNTPMDDAYGTLKKLHIDVDRYEKPSLWKKIKRFFKVQDPGFWEDLLMKFMPLIVVGLMTAIIYFLTGRWK